MMQKKTKKFSPNISFTKTILFIAITKVKLH